MWCRALLAAVAVACTLTRIHAVGPRRLDTKKEKNTKDVLCKLILIGVQKGDLDEGTLQKLRRYNVNINDLNNETVKNECMTLISKTVNSTVESRQETYNVMNTYNETYITSTSNYDNVKKISKPPNEHEPFYNGSAVIKTNKKNDRSDAKTYECSLKYIKYNNGQPSLNSMVEFWQNCIKNVRKPNNVYNYKNNIKLKETYQTVSNKTYNDTIGKINKYNKTLDKQKYIKEQKIKSVNNSYRYTPAKYNTKNNMENILETLVKVNELSQLVPILPDNSMFNPRNEPNKSLEKKPSMFNKLITIYDGNLFNPRNMQNSNLYQRNTEINDSYNTLPKISDTKHRDSKNLLNKDPRARSLFYDEDFFKTTDGRIISYAETHRFRRETNKGTPLPNTIPDTTYKRFIFYPESDEPNSNNSISTVFDSLYTDTVSNAVTIPETEFVYQEVYTEPMEENKSKTISSTHNVENNSTILNIDGMNKLENLKASANVSSMPENNFYYLNTTNRFIHPNEPKAKDDTYNNTYNILQHILNTNIDNIINKTVNSINSTDDLHINEKNVINENEQNISLQNKEVVNINKSEKVHNLAYDALFNIETNIMKNISKNIPINVNSSVFNKITTNKVHNQEQPKLYHLNQKLKPSKRRHKSELSKEDETEILYTKRDATNTVLASKELPNLGVTNSIPKNIIMDIAASVKAMVLNDIKKELLVLSTITTKTVTTTTTTTTETGNTQTNYTNKQREPNEFMTRVNVLNKLLKMLEQLNILKRDALNVSKETLQPKNNKINILDSNVKSSTSPDNTELTTAKKPGPPRCVIVGEKQNKTQVELNNRPVNQKYMPLPLSFQAELLEIPPVHIYVDKYLDPISENIVLTTTKPSLTNIQNDTISYLQNELKEPGVNMPPVLLKGMPTTYANIHHMPPYDAVMNVNNKQFTSVEKPDTNVYSENNNVMNTFDPRYTQPNLSNNAPRYYTYRRSVNTGNTRGNKLHVSQLLEDCCNGKIPTRQQLSLSDTKDRPASRIRSLIKKHKKVNNLLQDILSRNQYDTKFRSVELI